MRLLAALSVLASSVLFERLVAPCTADAARWGAAWFAVAALGDVWIGRLTFALGVSLALAAGLALARGRWPLGAARWRRCARPPAPWRVRCWGSPALTRGARAALAAGAARAGGAPPRWSCWRCALLFPEGGYEPYPILSFAATVLVDRSRSCGRCPPGARLLRIGALRLPAGVPAAAWLVHTPMGSNIERYGVLLAGPLLLCAAGRGGGEAASRGGGRPAAALALCAIAVWVAWGPVRETLAVAGSEATSASYYAPVERFLARVQAPPAAPVRVEVPLTRSHWEAALLAPTVSLARGWEKQLETRFDGVLLAPG